MDKIRTAIYTRISTKKEQQQTSKESQEMFYREYIAGRPEWEFCGIYGDSMSGTKLNRPDFDRLMFRCGIEVKKTEDEFVIRKLKKEKEIDLIICKSTSRFCRNIDGASLLNALKEKGVYVFFETIGKSTKEVEDEMMINMLLSIDDNYSKSLSKSARWGFIRAVETRHQVYGGHTLYGYNCIKKDGQNYLEPISEQYVEIVNQIFKWYIEGKGFRVIAKKLDELGFKSTVMKDGKYASIGKHGVKRILTNERYMGYNQIPIRTDEDFRKIGKIERKEGNYRIEKSAYITPMVSEELWHKANDILNNKPLTKRNKGVKGKSSKYAKYLMCGNCGKSMMVAQGHNEKRLYVCTTKRKNKAAACCLPYISEKFLDDFFRELWESSFITDEIARRKFYIEQTKNLKIAMIKAFLNTDNSVEVANLKQEIEELVSKQEALILSTIEYSDEEVRRSIRDVIEKLQKEITAKKERLNKIQMDSTRFKQEINGIDDLIEEFNESKLEEFSCPDDILKEIQVIRVFPNQPERTKQQLMNDVYLDYATRFQDRLGELYFTKVYDIALEEGINMDLKYSKEEEQELMDKFYRL